MEVDVNKVYTWANRAGYEFFGEDVIGREAAFFFEGEQSTYNEVQPLFEGDEHLLYVESWQRRQDGAKRLLSWRCRVLKDNSGQVTGVLSSATDITEEKQYRQTLQASEEKFRNLVKLVPIPLCFVDKDGVLSYFNDRFIEVFGYSSSDVPTLKEWWQQAYPDPDYRKWVLETWENAVAEAAREGKDIKPVEYMVTCKDGSERIIEISGIIIGENFLATFIDLTEHKRFTNELMEAKEKAELSDRLKSTFLANMSHEIRTPMNAIMGFAGMLSDPELSETERSRFSGIIQSRSEYLMHIVNDLLEISRIESGNASVVKERVHLKELVGELESEFHPRLKKTGIKNLALVPQPGEAGKNPVIMSDRTILKQIFSNLLDNALKFTDSGSVRFGYKPPEHNSVTFFVADTGIGISPENQKVIFEHFRQADIPDQQKYGGTGLGLSICKGFTGLLGGKIWVESLPGKGSTFFFSLPYEAEEDHFQAREGSAESRIGQKVSYNWSGRRIILVEDEPCNMDFLQIILGRTRAELVPAYNAADLRALYDKLDTFDLGYLR